MILTYKYQLKPSKRQHAALSAILESQRLLYNAALEERIGAYRNKGKNRSLIDQQKSLTECRRDLPEMAALSVNIQRWTLRHLAEAYAGFFRRMKDGRKTGLPRFKGAGRWRSFGFDEFRGIKFRNRRLYFNQMPSGLRVHMHRPLPTDADIRSCVFRRDHKGWSICFQIALADAEKRPGAKSIGIDLGLKIFAYQSDGIAIVAPQFSRNAQKEIRRRQRALARCKRGSARRHKVKMRLIRTHAKIANCRSTWLHQQSAKIVQSYDLIAVEDLNVAGMIKNRHLAHSISDASWSAFLNLLSYKAANAGATFIKVNPRNTSQRCSGCGELVPKLLAVRTHACPHCGLVIDRDWNASLNILQAVAGLGQHNVAQWGERAARNLALVTK